MTNTKSISIIAQEIEYGGDYLGDNFLFHLVIFDQTYFSKIFRLELNHGEILSLDPSFLNFYLTFDEQTDKISVPISLLVAEQASNQNGLWSAARTDFGHNVSVFNVDLSDETVYPITSTIYLYVDVYNGYLSEGTKRGPNKIGQINLKLEVTVLWENAPNFGPGAWVIEAYKKGRRNFEGAQLQNAFFPGVSLPGISLKEANLQWGDLSKSDFGKSNLSQSVLRAVKAHNTIFEQAQLVEADLIEADFTGVEMVSANLTAANINTKFFGANLKGVNLSESRIRDTNFQKANLTKANFRNAHLNHVDFRNAILRGADFTGALVEHVDYTGADISDIINFEVANQPISSADSKVEQSEEFQKGFREGVLSREAYDAEIKEVDDHTWRKYLKVEFPDASSEFIEGYKEGFTYAFQQQ